MVATKILNGIEVDGPVTADEFVGPLNGNATSATTAATASKLSSNAGSATKPIYFENGVPKVTTYELNKTVPADAKFTDTTYSAKSGGGLDLNGTEFSVKTGFIESGRNYAVVKDAAGDLYVSVPWTDTTDYTKLSNTPTIPSKTSELTNDSGFITKAIADLTNYYTKTETYTKTEVNNLISAKLVFSVVSSLPASGDASTIYLVPAASSETGNQKDEYIWVNSKWELIGSTKFQLTITQNASGISINSTALQASSATQAGLMTSAQASKLAGIAEGAEVNVNADWNAASGDAQILNKPSLATVATSGSYNDLSNKPTIPAAQVNSDWNATSGKAQILNKPTIPTALSQLSADATHRVVTDTEKSTWNGKQNALTFDSAPASGSTNPVTSGGIYSALAAKANTSSLATVATSGSYNDLSNKPTIPTKYSANITVPAAGGTVNVTNMTSTADVIVGPAPADQDVYTTAGCKCTAQGNGTLTFTVSKTATAAMSVNVIWFV